MKDSTQNIEILFDKLIKKYNNLKSENLEIKNKIDFLTLVEDLRNSKLNPLRQTICQKRDSFRFLHLKPFFLK